MKLQLSEIMEATISELDDIDMTLAFEIEAIERLSAGALEECRHFFIRQRIEHVNRGAREQGGINFERRVLCCGTNERYCSLFYSP